MHPKHDGLRFFSTQIRRQSFCLELWKLSVLLLIGNLMRENLKSCKSSLLVFELFQLKMLILLLCLVILTLSVK